MTDAPAGRALPDSDGSGRAALVQGDVEFDGDDAALLRAVERTGSVAGASSELGRSRARALSRIETIESAFDDLVERRRGGSDGGGSRLTEHAVSLLGRYDRLQAAVSATASAPETVLRGTVTSVDGELATVDVGTATVRGLHDGIEVGERTQVRIGADAVTLLTRGSDPDPDSTSARNRLTGRVADFDSGETVSTVAVDVEGAVFRVLVTEDSASRLDVRPDRRVVLTWKATATRLVPVGGS